MNPNEMIYFNALVLQRDFHEEARRSREGERASARPAETRTARSESKGHDHTIRGFFSLALPGRR